MNLLKGPAKGQSEKLDISSTQSNRLLVGLSWDPLMSGLEYSEKRKDNEDILDVAIYYAKNAVRYVKYEHFKDKAKRLKEDEPGEREDYDFFDLDLHCYIFDQDGNFQTKIGPEYEEAIDDSSSTYHSGEDFTGTGGPDDELIHIETKNTPENYKHFVFFVRSDCKYSLDKINDPVIRLADSKTEDNFLEVSIKPPANLNAYAYIFAHIYQKDGEWFCKHLSDYADFNTDWETELKKYIA